MALFCGRVVRAPATEAVDAGSIPSRVKPKSKKLVSTASLLDLKLSNKRGSVKPPPCVW